MDVWGMYNAIRQSLSSTMIFRKEHVAWYWRREAKVAEMESLIAKYTRAFPKYIGSDSSPLIMKLSS